MSDMSDDIKIPDGWERFDPEPGDQAAWITSATLDYDVATGEWEDNHRYVGRTRDGRWVYEGNRNGFDFTGWWGAHCVPIRPVETVTVTLRRDTVEKIHTQGLSALSVANGQDARDDLYAAIEAASR